MRSTPNWPLYIWHHRAHTDRRGERLLYWRASFVSGYERDRVTSGIESACRSCGVVGLIVYELFGAHDILIRAWLPEGRNVPELDLALTEELKPTGLDEWAGFAVNYMVRHWPFIRSDGSTDGPEERWLNHLQDSEILEVETDWPDVRPELIERLKAERLITPLDEGTFEAPGIKFIVEVSSDAGSDVRTLAEFEEKLVEVLDSARGIRQRSLYAGTGFAHFLIMGRVDYDKFHAIHSELISKINTGALSETYRARTMTHISGQRGYRIAWEALSGGSGPQPASRLSAFLPRRADPEPDAVRVLEPGEEFGGRFEIISHLGGGGFANVYAAKDVFDEGVVRALKIFKSADGRAAIREMSALRRIEHPNVVKAIWGDHYGPHWYLVTEFVDGQPLDSCPARDEIWALSVMIEVLDALVAVHPDDRRIEELRARDSLEDVELNELQRLKANGLIHRDVKPANILVGADGRVTLVDFNIASPAREPTKTRTGTLAYMAPDAGFERWEPADDLFSCGVVLYELLLAKHPFPDRLPVSGLPPTDPLALRPALPATLAAVLTRACQTIRAHRYESAQEMRRDLEHERRSLEQLDSTVRGALWRWREQTYPIAAASVDGQAPRPTTGAPLKLARILLDELNDGEFGLGPADGEKPRRKSAGQDGGEPPKRDDGPGQSRLDDEDDEAEESVGGAAQSSPEEDSEEEAH